MDKMLDLDELKRLLAALDLVDIQRRVKITVHCPDGGPKGACGIEVDGATYIRNAEAFDLITAAKAVPDLIAEIERLREIEVSFDQRLMQHMALADGRIERLEAALRKADDDLWNLTSKIAHDIRSTLDKKP